MAPSPRQLAWRGRIEAVLRLTAPALDLLLAAGDKVARTVEPDDREPALPPRTDGGDGPSPRQRRVGPGR
jgi:hypothetical protein